MRTGFVTAKNPGTQHDLSRLPQPGPTSWAARVLARQTAVLLARIHEASGRGDTKETLRLAARLASTQHRAACRPARKPEGHEAPEDYDSTAY